MSEQTVKVKARVGFAAPGWQCERGDDMDVPVSDARRLVARGLAVPVNPEEPCLKRMSREEQEDARRVDHESEITDAMASRLGLEPTRGKRR